MLIGCSEQRYKILAADIFIRNYLHLAGVGESDACSYK